MMPRALAALALLCSAAAESREPAGLHAVLSALEREGKFSGAVVVRDANGVRFARGYGMADPFTGRRFTPDTPVDSASLAKPVTAAAVLILAREGRIGLDQYVQLYWPGYPHRTTTIRHLLAHSAGLSGAESAEALAGKTNAELVGSLAGRAPDFPPGTAFAYCNYCYMALAELIERVTGRPYLDVVRDRVGLPQSVTIRPARLADWTGRAIGYRRIAAGKVERADSYEDERLYGTANLSLSASQLAQWGAAWWGRRLASVQPLATAPARIAAARSGLSLGNWHCSESRRQCHYLGHHEGFHHMLYWNAGRRLSVAMVSNNALAPALQQRLQRAIVAFAEGRAAAARRELAQPLSDDPIGAGAYLLRGGETVTVAADRGMSVASHGLDYRAFRIANDIAYVPGLDTYLAAAPGGVVRWLSLYRDATAMPRNPK